MVLPRSNQHNGVWLKSAEWSKALEKRERAAWHAKEEVVVLPQ
jgi:hypothetical protein